MTYHEPLANFSFWFWVEMANHLWQSTLFLLLIFLAAVVLGKAAAKSRYAVWLLAAAKFALPLSAFAVVGEWLSLNGLFSSAISIEPTASDGINFVSIISSSPPITTTTISMAEITNGHNEIYCVLTIFWLIGCLSLFALWHKRSRAFKKSLGCRNTPTSQREAELLNNAQIRIGLNVGVNFIVSDSISEPVALGIWQPTVVMTHGLSQKLTDNEFESVLMHELAHVKRRDNLVGVLQMALCCLLWFHPLVWLVKRKLLEEREQACDEAVVALGNKPQVYATGLLKVVRHGLHTYQSAGVANAASANLNKRLELIMDNKMRNTKAKWQRWIVGVTISIFVLICIASGFAATRTGNATEVLAASIGDEQSEAKFRQVEVYADGKLFSSMDFRSPKTNSAVFTYALYRIPEGQTAQTIDNQKIYAFQIIPTPEADSVKVETLAVLEDLNTVSNAHPLHEFKKQAVASFSLRVGESAVVSEMSQFGVNPLEIKVAEVTETENDNRKTRDGIKTVIIRKGDELPDVSIKIVQQDDSPLKITDATARQITNALFARLTGQTTVTTGADGKTIFPNVCSAPVVKMVNNSDKTISGFSAWVIDPRSNGEIRKTRVMIIGKPTAPRGIAIAPGQSYTVNFRDNHLEISEKYWLEFTDSSKFYVTVATVQFDDGTSWTAKDFEK